MNEGKKKRSRGNNAARIVAYFMAQRKLNVKLIKINDTYVKKYDVFKSQQVKKRKKMNIVIKGQ